VFALIRFITGMLALMLATIAMEGAIMADVKPEGRAITASIIRHMRIIPFDSELLTRSANRKCLPPGGAVPQHGVMLNLIQHPCRHGGGRS